MSDGIAAVRGAVQVPANTAADILEATTRLLTTLLDVNHLVPARIVSAVFTTTEDLDADFPAHAARKLGWTDVPMLNAREIPVPGSMARVVRVLLTVTGVERGTRPTPVYLDGAAALRPDLAGAGGRSAPASSTAAKPAPSAPPASARPTRTLAIVGLGQIGGSVAWSLAGLRWRRIGFDTDAGTLEAARSAGAIDEAAATLEEACANAALAVVATPVDTLSAVIDGVAASLPKGAALLDTGSARGPVNAALERAARRGLGVVGGHPLAGSEGRGFAAARAGLFTGATFALFPTGGPPPAIVLELLADLGARALVTDPAAHDRAVARTSHLPYLVATALHEIGADSARAGLSGPGFRDMTRLAASDPRIAGAFCRANADEIQAAWRELRDRLDRSVGGLGA